MAGGDPGARPPFTGSRSAPGPDDAPLDDELSRSHSRRRPGRLLDVVVALALVAASLVLTSVHVSQHHDYSAFDEYVYIDYYARVLDEGIVREGSHTEDFARRYISCHKNRAFGAWQPQLCRAGAKRPADMYPIAGFTTADLYPPIYFYAIRVAAQPLVWAGVDFVQAGRYATSLWLVLAVVLLYAGLRRRGANAPLSAAGCLLLMSSVGAYFSSTYISTDAVTIPAGAAMLLLAQLYLDRPSIRLRVTIIGVAALAGLMKVQNLEAVAVLVMLFVFAAAAARSEGRGPRRWTSVLRDHRVVTGVVAIGLAAVAQVAWLAIRSALTVGPGADFGISRGYRFPSDFVSDLVAFLFSAAQVGGAVNNKVGTWAGISASAFGLLVAAGVLGLAFASGTLSRERQLGWAVLIASAVSGPVLSAATIVSSGSYVPLAERYGTALLPAMIACIVFLPTQRSRAVNIAGLAVGVAFYAMGLAFSG